VSPTRRCDRLAELSALAHTAGSLHLRGHGEIALHLDLASSAVARRAFRLLRELGVESEIRTYRQHAFEQATRYQLHVADSPAARKVLVEAGIVSPGGGPLSRPPKRVVGRECCRAAYVRGALLGAGSVSGPRSSHLEIRCASLEAAELLVRLAALDDVPLRARDRGRHAIAYAKSADAIAELLALAGASDAALAVDEHAVVGAARAHANRLANADQANLVRASRAAHTQLRAVRQLAEEGRLDTLPLPLREIADLRARNPSLSLRELAAKCRPPATKAAAHRRLARLIRLAGL
jgi:DNA-binding protein WhiA